MIFFLFHFLITLTLFPYKSEKRIKSASLENEEY